MDLLHDDLKQLYKKYLLTSIGSALVISIYNSVDIMAVGHYCGPSGAASLSIINPIWPIITFFGIILGMGGAIQMSSLRGADKHEEGDTFFRTSMLTGIIMCSLITILMLVFMPQILMALGSNEELLSLSLSYANWLAIATPAFFLDRILSAYISNDGNPGLCTKAAMIGGFINIIGDIYFVFDFGLGMGMYGAGLATALGQMVAVAVQLTYFKDPTCKLKWKKSKHFFKDLGLIFKNGTGIAFLSSIEAVAIVLYNKQIMRYGTVTDLSIYGTLCNIKWVFESLFFGAGMAVQPLVSSNFGAKNYDRITKLRKMYLTSSMVLGMSFALISFVFSKQIYMIYMTVTPEILNVGIPYMHLYAIGFIVMGINVVSAYYLDAQMQPRKSFAISSLRGFILVALFIYTIPVKFGTPSIFYIMPIVEYLTLIYTTYQVRKYPLV